MKISPTIASSLGNMAAVTSAGDICQIIADSMLAVARGEMADDKLLVLAKGADSIAKMYDSQVKVARAKVDLGERGKALGKDMALGQLPVRGS